MNKLFVSEPYLRIEIVWGILRISQVFYQIGLLLLRILLEIDYYQFVFFLSIVDSLVLMLFNGIETLIKTINTELILNYYYVYVYDFDVILDRCVYSK